MTKKEIFKAIEKFDPGVKVGSWEHLAYQVLYAAAMVGPHQQPILRLLKTSRWRQVLVLIARAKRNNIFRDGKLDAEIYEDGVGFALGATCLLGWIKRTPACKGEAK